MQIKILKPFLYDNTVEVQQGIYTSNADGDFLIDCIDKRLMITEHQGADYNQFANAICKFSFKEYEIQKLIDSGNISLISQETSHV